MEHVLITGVHTGLGHALARLCLERGCHVFGLSRTLPEDLAHPELELAQADLSAHEQLALTVERLLRGERRLDYVYLNAGVLGDLAPLARLSLDRLRRVMDVNVWANKVLLDVLLSQGRSVGRVVAISSAASHLGSAGWGGYAMSKAALNLLLRVAAHEYPATHFVSVAPGLVRTPMLRRILHDPEASRFEAGRRIRAADEQGAVLSPEQAARRLLDAREVLAAQPSGSYVDLRELSGQPAPQPSTAASDGRPSIPELMARIARPGPGRGKAIAALRQALRERDEGG